MKRLLPAIVLILLFGAPAVAAMQDDMRNENWPAGTLKSTQFELRALFDLPPVSEMPPER